MTFEFRRVVLLGALLFSVLVPLQTQAQVFPRGNGISLSEGEPFDIYVELQDWEGMPEDKQEFRLKLQKLFVAGVEAVGAPRRVATRHSLICRVQATLSDDVVAYTSSVEFWDVTPVGVHTMLWQNGGIGITQKSQFNEQMLATQCLTYFTDEWSKWNP